MYGTKIYPSFISTFCLWVDSKSVLFVVDNCLYNVTFSNVLSFMAFE